MKIKSFIFILFLLAIVADFVWSLGYWTIDDMSDLDRKLFGIRSGIAHLHVVGMYIAWRLTP